MIELGFLLLGMLLLSIAILLHFFNQQYYKGWEAGRNSYENWYPHTINSWKDDVKFKDGGGATFACFTHEKTAEEYVKYLNDTKTDKDTTYYVG